MEFTYFRFNNYTNKINQHISIFIKYTYMKFYIALIFLFQVFTAYSQTNNFKSEDIAISEHIDGTLLELDNSNASTLAIIIAGSGPTDRNGNQNFMKSNSLKSLAEALTEHNIATFRYDKRVVKQILKGKVDPNIMFDDFVTDAQNVVDYFKKKNTFKNIVVIGHSQGSLVGMLASQDNADAFISLAGAGQDISEVIIEQIAKTAPFFTEETKRVFGVLKSGKTTTDYPPALVSIFNIELQPFMMNWMQYNPAELIANLEIPVLIVNGTKDLQVSVEEAKLLHEALPKSEIVIIENMNHVLFTIEGDDLENSKSYNEGFRKINPELITSIKTFIDKLDK